MEDKKKAQEAFHQDADEARFLNRLDNPWIRRREMQTLGRIAALASNARSVLEVGCGEGSNLRYLGGMMRRTTLTGIDFSEAKIEFAKKMNPDGVFRRADALSLPFDDASFDFVFCRDLLHHVDFNRTGVIAEMARVARPGGMIAVLEGRGKTPLNLLFQFLCPVERGMYRSDPASLLALGKQFGAAKLDFVEPSFFVRALGFLFGWPKNHVRGHFCIYILRLGYSIANLWERAMGGLLPKRYWAYMLLVIQRGNKEAT